MASGWVIFFGLFFPLIGITAGGMTEGILRKQVGNEFTGIFLGGFLFFVPFVVYVTTETVWLTVVIAVPLFIYEVIVVAIYEQTFPKKENPKP